MKTILLFGAGRSATVLIDYLIENAVIENWNIIVVDADEKLAASKIGVSQRASALSFDIDDANTRDAIIRKADIVISLLPPQLHIKVALSCLEAGRDLLTASYIDDTIRALSASIEQKKLLFLCEMGLDPGIDHMSAMKLIDEIHSAGGKIHTFRSHCGGLVAPESDDNPWHYKISWNSRNVVNAGKSGAHYRENGKDVHVDYTDLFDAARVVAVPGLGEYSWYPNRDSLSYTGLYGLEDTSTFVRTTLRHPDFMHGWKNIIELKLTNDLPVYNTEGKTLQAAFKQHMETNGFSEWLNQKLQTGFDDTKSVMEQLLRLVEAENVAQAEGNPLPDRFMAADNKGNLNEVEIDEVKSKATAFLASRMNEANTTLRQLFFLGIDDDITIIDKDQCTPADLLQFALDHKLSLRPYDHDMIVMLHEIGYEIDGADKRITSCLIVKGENNLRTAMAKTVGLPLGIAAKNILNGKIRTTGLQIPTSKEIYLPVLAELEKNGVKFDES